MIPLHTVFLLPEQRRFAGAELSSLVQDAMARAVRLPTKAVGYQSQLQRYFFAESALPVASALACASDDTYCMRAEPAFVRAEMGVMRLMAYGEQLELSDQERSSLVGELLNHFNEGEWRFSVDALDGWSFNAKNPAFVPEFPWPEDLLGADIFPVYQLKQTKFWNACSVEAQIILHNSPVNQRRMEQGQLPANALLFWGAGSGETPVRSSAKLVQTDEQTLRALYNSADRQQTPVEVLIDMRHERDFDAVFQQSIFPVIDESKFVHLDFADGNHYQLHKSQRFKFWRKRWTFDA